MLLRPLLPDHRSLALDEVRLTADGIRVHVTSMLPNNRCPLCGWSSTRVHSRYQRKLADLPWQGLAVRIYWCSRKFFCDNPACPQRVFTERLPDVAKPYSRKTCRLAAVFGALGFACGGEGGARLAERLGMHVSPDCLLRVIRRTALPEIREPRVVGVDDWAFRRGEHYGTILCDLEQHQRIDVLPDRSSESLENWLKAHPSVEIVSRDRADFYIKGTAAGAPRAIQVTDRWHLLNNLREALVRIVNRHSKQVEAAVTAVTEADHEDHSPPASVADNTPILAPPLEQWPDGGTCQSAKTNQAADVWEGQV
jgi:transposase